MKLRNNRGEYLLQWKCNGNMFNISRTTDSDIATTFDTAFIFDMLEMLDKNYPGEHWMAE